MALIPTIKVKKGNTVATVNADDFALWAKKGWEKVPEKAPAAPKANAPADGGQAPTAKP